METFEEVELPKEGFVKVEVAAKFLSINKRQMYEVARKGLVPSVRIGRRVRFNVRDLRDIASGKIVLK